jgi:hypothetical protein
MTRLDIKESTLKKLFALSGNRCAFPDCTQAVVNEDGDLIAEVCHIEAANEGGQRWNSNQSDEDRRGFENLLILCPTHHAVTDNEAVYPVERMRGMKREHEQRFAAQPLALDDAWIARLIEQVARQMSREVRPVALPYPSLGPLFKGRDEFLAALRTSLCGAAEGHATAIVGKAVHGLGGVGKTRLSAWGRSIPVSEDVQRRAKPPAKQCLVRLTLPNISPVFVPSGSGCLANPLEKVRPEFLVPLRSVVGPGNEHHAGQDLRQQLLLVPLGASV